MARKLVLEGPAAAAVERLARQAGISPAELIKRALRREDETQRKDEGKPIVSAGISTSELPHVAGSEVPRSEPSPGAAQLGEAIAQATVQHSHNVHNPVAGAALGLNPRRVSREEYETLTRGTEISVDTGSQADLLWDDPFRLPAMAFHRRRSASRPEALVVVCVFDENRLSFELPYPEPGELGFAFPGGRLVVKVPQGDAKPSVRFERDAESSLTRREPGHG